MQLDLISRIKDFNHLRDEGLLAIKYKAMYEDEYRFYRATAHLFFEDIASNSFIHKAPLVWICGDLHLENFGSYKGDNRLAYFNVNDFDECILASPLLDIARFLTSIHAASSNLKVDLKTITKLSDLFLNTYFDQLQKGYIRVLEKETATGIIKTFLEDIKQRKRKEFIKKRTVSSKGKIKLLIDNKRTSKINKTEKEAVKIAIEKWAKKNDALSFYKVKDVALRISGTASLGLKRYVVLIEGKGSPDNNYLIDAKETRPSCVQPYINAKQPNWNSESERIVEVQQRFLSDPPALLHSLDIDNKNFVVKELQPTADRIDYHLFSKNEKKLGDIIKNMAAIYAWSNLRTTGRDGSASADDLIAFSKNTTELKIKLKEYAKNYSKKLKVYHRTFAEAYLKNEFI